MEADGYEWASRARAAQAPGHLRRNWRIAAGVGSDSARRVWVERLSRDRTSIVPWLDTVFTLPGSSILEIGGGRGASTVALAEQGAAVTVLDVNPVALLAAKQSLDAASLRAHHVLGNAADPPLQPGAGFDAVIFWASFEHMTSDERRRSLLAAWNHLTPAGVLVVIEAPNRLWPFDSHTSDLPFFHWLPDDLATRYTAGGLRSSVVDLQAGDTDALARLGRGVSFHDFSDPTGRLPTIVSCMQLQRRSGHPVQGLGRHLSSAGRTERLLRSFAPEIDRAWFQPFLYVALRPTHAEPPPGEPPRNR